MNVFYSQSTKCCNDWLDWTVPKPRKPPTGPQNVLNMLNVLRNQHPEACWPQSERVKPLSVSMFPAFPVEFFHYWWMELSFFDVLCAAASCHGWDKMYTCTEEKKTQKKGKGQSLRFHEVFSCSFWRISLNLQHIFFFARLRWFVSFESQLMHGMLYGNNVAELTATRRLKPP